MKISTQKQATNKSAIFRNVGIFSASFLVAASVLYLYSPVVKTHAETAVGNVDVTLSITEDMSLVLSANNLNLVTNPNTFTSGTIDAVARTSSKYGYTLTIEDLDSEATLVHSNYKIDDNLTSTFSGSKSSSEMERNTWGFSLDDINYHKIPVSGSPVAVKRSLTKMETESETTTVRFGAKVGNVAAGSYTDDIVFTIYSNGQNGKPKNIDDPDDPE